MRERRNRDHGDNVTPLRPRGGAGGGAGRSSGPPAFNLPPMTRMIAMVLIAIHVIDWFAGGAIARHAVFSGLHDGLRSLFSLFTYALVHASLGHLAMNLVGLVILGKVLEPRIGGKWLLIMLAIGSAAGALVHILVSSGWLIGSSAGIGALYGVALPAAKNGRFGAYDRLVILLSLLFVGISLAGLVLPIMGGVAHAAHLGGFLAGLFMSQKLIR
ncbi:MAG: rhomboid family intramembrane serine protease [Geminicoccaceae bacterium]|nr:rhomboid family intramembrane serine protease [Geminicoccaceae bacterium]MCB2011651.1 rhomboid family intramembrane serine protease [Geminicoccaceae bacterium]